MHLNFNPALLCVLALFRTHHHSWFSWPLPRLKSTLKFSSIKCKIVSYQLLLFFPQYVVECNTSQNFAGSNKPRLLNVLRNKCNTCFKYGNKIMTNMYVQYWSTRRVFLWNHYHFLLHVIEKFQCAKLQSEQKGLDSRIQISAVICWTNSPNNFITVGTINSVLILMLVLVTCMLCIYLELKIILNLEYFHFPTTNYNIQTKNNMANTKMFNFPNDVL